MPYDKSKPPDRIKGLPEHAQQIFMSAFDAAWEEYGGNEEKCNKVAWAAVKKKYKKDGDKWVAMKGSEMGMAKEHSLDTPMEFGMTMFESETPDMETGLVKGAVLIRAGWGSGKSRYYPVDTLRSAASRYDGVKVFCGHGTVEEQDSKKAREIGDWVGNVVPGTVTFDEERKAVVADIQMVKGNPQAVMLLEMARDSLVRQNMGLSHKAYGAWRNDKVEGKATRLIEAIREVSSVDFVTEAGAGGQIAQAVIESEVNGVDEVKTREELEARYPALILEFREAVVAEARTELETAKRRIAELEATIAKTDRENKARAILAEAGISEKGVSLILEAVMAGEFADDEALKAVCEEKAKVFTEALQEGRKRPAGIGPSVVETPTEDDRLADGLKRISGILFGAGRN